MVPIQKRGTYTDVVGNIEKSDASNFKAKNMKAIFNPQGRTIAWIRGTEIFDFYGRNIGFLRNNAVFNLNAYYKGTFSNGFFRDIYGHAVAFTNGASHGPVPPVPEVPPVAPIPNIPAIHPIPSIPPIPPIPSYNWSAIEWSRYIN